MNMAPLNSNVPLTEWMEAMVQALGQVAINPLGYKGSEVLSYPKDIPDGNCGSYIPLRRNEESIRLCLLMDQRGRQAIARSLFCMSPGDDDLDEQDVGDALGEILNIMSGLIKAHMGAKAVEQNQAKVEVKIGLPGLLSNASSVTTAPESSIAKVRIGPVFGLLVITRE
jgi:chemotaxis protein CheY-P-specific phosphatase CheC